MLNYDEVLRQEYSGNNCVFSAGFVTGHEVDTMYLRFEKDGVEPEIIHLRPDEMACIAWLASGVLWSDAMRHLTPVAADTACAYDHIKLAPEGHSTCPECGAIPPCR